MTKPKPTQSQVEYCKSRWHPSPPIPGFWVRRIIHPDRPTGFTAAGPQPEYSMIEVGGGEQCLIYATDSANAVRTMNKQVAWRLLER